MRNEFMRVDLSRIRVIHRRHGRQLLERPMALETISLFHWGSGASRSCCHSQGKRGKCGCR